MTIIRPNLEETISILWLHASWKTKVWEAVAQESWQKCADLDIETAKRVLQLLTLQDFNDNLWIDTRRIDSELVRKIQEWTLQVSDYSKIVPGWHKEWGLFRKWESKTLREIIEEFKIVITWGWTYTIEENRWILKPTVKIMLDVPKEEQARRLRKDVDGNTRRGTKWPPQPWCNLSPEERQIKEIGEFYDQWVDLIRDEVDYIFTCSEDKSIQDMRNEILSTPQIQDILQYNR